MSHKKPRVNPQLYKHFVHALHEEKLAIFSLFKFQWPIIIVFLIALLSLVFFAKPLPPSHIKLATGQPNSSLEKLGKKYVDYFAKNGVEVELVSTAGAFENIDLLKKGKVDAAFSLAGISLDSDVSGIASLGSVEYQPFWLFYRGKEYDGTDPAHFFEDKKFAVNIPGSGTRNLSERILSLHGIELKDTNKFLSLPSGENASALLSGKVDGVFLVAGFESKTIKEIIEIPDIHIFNFSTSEAYAKRLKYLEVLNLPHGAIDIKRFVPYQDTQMVATTTTILANTKLHAAIQYLFLEAAHQITETEQTLFNRPGGFPAYIERSIPVSPIAERYYTKGPSALAGYAPYWLASFFDQAWFIIFAAIAIGYPLFKIIPNYRKIYASFCLTDSYEDLTELDLELSSLLSKDELDALTTKFKNLEKRIDELWVPAALIADFYKLRNSVDIVRNKISRIQGEILN